MTITTVEQEMKARQRADQRIRAEGKGVARYDGAWPARPSFASVEWQGPASAGLPPDAHDGDTLIETD